MKRKQRCAALLLALIMGMSLVTAAAEGAEDILKPFVLNHGDRNSRKIAITVDDGYEPEYYWEDVALCREYGITMTFFPIGKALKEEDREHWKDALDAGCEIGSHTDAHIRLGLGTPWETIWSLGHFQQTLDEVLGFHYEVRWMRPPYGNIDDENGNSHAIRTAIEVFGYDHIVRWDVSQTKAKEAIKKVQNGSILLFHTRKKDTDCLKELIPMLLEKGFEPVTVSELFGFDPPETGTELYVYDAEVYRERGQKRINGK